jgi:DNA-binding NtrC family response regulator
MATESPILCVVGNEDEAGEFKKALAALSISNPMHCVVGAANAMEFLDHRSQAKQATPAVVFFSLRAPDANRLTAWFEAHPENRPAGLIAMTGFEDMRQVIHAYHLGVTAFLQWPLKAEDVRAALNSNPELTLEQRNGSFVISRL